MQGKIKRLVEDRGFGFIEVDGRKSDVFFHLSGLAGGVKFDELRAGDSVEFDITEGEKGPKAQNVRLV